MLFKQIRKLPIGPDWNKIIITGLFVVATTALLIGIHKVRAENEELRKKLKK